MTYSTRKSRIKQALLLIGLALSLVNANADAPLPDLEDGIVSVKEINPTRDAGYVVGDTLERTLVIEIKQPYELVKESLPIVGYEHRWKGKISGVELVKTSHQEDAQKNSTAHTVYLAYQVFTSGRVAKPSALRAEIIKLRNTKTKVVKQYRLPSFNFRISPLSVFGQVVLKDEISPFHPPLLLDSSPQIRNMKLLGGLLGLSLLGLLYMLGMHTWLPRMGAPFAKAYRDIRKLQNTEQALKSAVERIHQALNQTAGTTLFSHTTHQLIEHKPQFAPMQAEINTFFSLSNHVFFGASSMNEELVKTNMVWLLSFCRHMRDCERGLTPDLAKQASVVKGI